jgi:hypothetical protein
MLDNFDPLAFDGFSFYDNKSKRSMRYVYANQQTKYAGWILYQHPDGNWVTLRKATVADVSAISEAVVRAHHDEPENVEDDQQNPR